MIVEDREFFNAVGIARDGSPIGAFYGYETDGLFTSIQEIEAHPVMSFLSKHTLVDTITIAVSDGVYELNKPIILNHKDGNLIRVVGNSFKPSKCRIIAKDYNSAFIINNGHSIGLISGFQFIGQGDKVVPPFEDGPTLDSSGLKMGDGVGVYGGSFAKVVNCDFRKWLHGCTAWGGSTIVAANCTASNNWDNGFFAYNNSAFFGNNCISNTSSSGKGGLGFGFLQKCPPLCFYRNVKLIITNKEDFTPTKDLV